MLVLPHGNSEPERGFSINRDILQVHGSSIKEDTIVAVRMVKDHIIADKGMMNIPITRGLLKSCSDAYQKYEVHLSALKTAEELRKKNEKERACKSTTGRKEN